MPCLRHLAAAYVELVRAVLRADLDHLAALLGQLDDLGALFDGVGDGFFEIDVLAGLERRDGHRVVQVLRRHDEDHVDVGIREHFAVVDGRLRGVLPLRLHVVLDAVQVAGVGVADVHDLDHVGARDVHLVHAVVSAAAGADPADAQFVVLAEGRQHGRRRSHSRHERPAGYIVAHDSSCLLGGIPHYRIS